MTCSSRSKEFNLKEELDLNNLNLKEESSINFKRDIRVNLKRGRSEASTFPGGLSYFNEEMEYLSTMSVVLMSHLWMWLQKVTSNTIIVAQYVISKNTS